MILSVYNQDLYLLAFINNFKSLIWTERYNEAGDFELYLQVTDEALKILKTGNYLINSDSKRIMVIEKIKIQDENGEADYIIVTGRSAESLLDRRIVWEKKELNGDFESEIRAKVFKPNFTNANIADRNMRYRNGQYLLFNYDAERMHLPERITASYLGENVYDDIIAKECKNRNIGFKFEFMPEYNDQTLHEIYPKFDFWFYRGVDRSLFQTDRPPVIFDPLFGNLTSSAYDEDVTNWKNVVLTGGEEPSKDEDGKWNTQSHTRLFVSSGTYKSLERREAFSDQSGLKWEESETESKYKAKLQNAGQKDIADLNKINTVEAEIDDKVQWTANVDYFLGDYVQLRNGYGLDTKAQISEMVYSYGEDTKICPTFNILPLSPFPSGEYYELEYVGVKNSYDGYTDNTHAYINTGLVAGSEGSTNIEVEFMLQETKTSSSRNTWNIILGAQIDTDNELICGTDGSGAGFKIDSGFGYASSFEKNTWVKGYGTVLGSVELPLYIFTWNDNGSPGANSYYGYKWTKSIIIRNDGDLTGYLIPAKRKSDNICGYYDLVRNIFLTEATGKNNKILGGPVKN